MKKLRKFLSITMILLMILSLINFSVVNAASMSGAIYTTDILGATNVNLYDSKMDVYLNGGPAHPGAAGLPDGEYYVQVTNPSGSVVLGSSVNFPVGSQTTIIVSGGEFAVPYLLWNIVSQQNNSLGYADTDNAGGVYKVWVSKDATFPNDATKTDNFRVKSDGGGGDDSLDGLISAYKFNDLNFNGEEDPGEPRLENWQINLYQGDILIDSMYTDINGEVTFSMLPAGTYTLTETQQDGWLQTKPSGTGACLVDLAESEEKTGFAFGNTQNGRLIVEKYYDANANGTFDDGELLLTPWKINISGIGDKFTRFDDYILNGNYTVSEYMPLQSNWIATDGLPEDVALGIGQTKTVMFGNLCIGPGGGLTLGFWSNKNGQTLFTSNTTNIGGMTDLNLMVSKNLRNANGTNFDPSSYSSFRSWLLNATATNMSYMLSAQLAAMELNVYNGKVNGNSLLWLGANSWLPNAISVNHLMSAANTELGMNGLVLSGHTNRAYQEFLKNALDNANNNMNFIQSAPCPFTF